MSTSRINNQTIKASAIRSAFAEIATGTSKQNGIRNSEFKSIKWPSAMLKSFYLALPKPEKIFI